ncbi:MAG: methane monooxygenase/ammonia monooxygenase subunit B [Methylococcales bacterium]
MVKITEQLADSVIVAEDLGLSDPSLKQFSGQRKVMMSAGVVFCKSRLLEELVNEADSRIDALAYFFFGNEDGRHVSNISSAVIPKLTH